MLFFIRFIAVVSTTPAPFLLTGPSPRFFLRRTGILCFGLDAPAVLPIVCGVMVSAWGPAQIIVYMKVRHCLFVWFVADGVITSAIHRWWWCVVKVCLIVVLITYFSFSHSAVPPILRGKDKIRALSTPCSRIEKVGG